MSKTILAVGAHIGDMELTCARCSPRTPCTGDAA